MKVNLIYERDGIYITIEPPPASSNLSKRWLEYHCLEDLLLEALPNLSKDECQGLQNEIDLVAKLIDDRLVHFDFEKGKWRLEDEG